MSSKNHYCSATATNPVKQKMVFFEKVCTERKERLTPLRRNVFAMILGCKSSIKAYDIIRALSHETKDVKPPVVYRTLEFLLKQGFIHRIERDNSYVSCEHLHEVKHPCMLVICHSCGEVKEFCDDSLLRIIQLNIHNTGFEMADTTLEVNGLCPECLKETKKLKTSL
jgi:Fur family zinc uptake transcriptional regulator